MTAPEPAPCASAVHGTIAAHGVTLHYLDWGGDGPPLLFLHGGSAHAHWWDPVIVRLGRSYRCVALDLRGHGASTRPLDGDYRLEAHAADVAAAIDALALAGCGLIGHSFGGWIALLHAATPTARIGALAIIDSRLQIGQRSARLLEALRKLPHPRYATREEAITRFRLMPAATCAAPALLAHVAAEAVRAAPDGTWTLAFDRRALAGASARDFAPALRAVRCPVLAVRGTCSTVVDAAALQAYHDAAPATALAEIDGAYHHVMLDRPEALAAVLHDFLAPRLAR